MSTLGARISLDFLRPNATLVAGAAELPTAVIGDVSNRLVSFPAGFTNFSNRRTRFAGPALTVKVRPGDNLFLHKALDIAQPGDVIVVDAGGALQTAIIGEMMASYAATKGVVAVIIDGAVRDRAGLANLDVAVIGRGTTPNGPFKSGPGEIGYAVSAGGLSVSAGDLIVGDEDGVLVLPQADAADILTRAQAHAIVEETWAGQIAAGTWPRAWVDAAIAQL